MCEILGRNRFKHSTLNKCEDIPFSLLQTEGKAVGVAMNIDIFVGRKAEGKKGHADSLCFSH